jgi:membrane-associated phospholipid phosphatase
MFQTDPHLWLQSFDSPFLRTAMQAVSLLGEEEFFALMIMALLFGFDRRRGFIMVQVVLWTAIVTGVLKDLLALPRPVHVDALVADYANGGQNPSSFIGRDAPGFLAPLPDDVVAYYRNVFGISYGFPSGHCSSSIAAWGSLALLFRHAWLIWCTFALLLLMPLSRMYLGRHFLADVIGGIALGMFILLAVATLQRGWALGRVGHGEHTKRLPWISWKEILFMLVVPAAAMMIFTGARQECAALLGLNIGYLVSNRLISLDPPRSVPRRILSIIVAAGVFVVLIAGVSALNSRFQLPADPLVILPQRTAVAAIGVIGAYWIIKRFLVGRTSTQSN